MSLVDIWKRTRDQIEEKNIKQIIGFAGHGKLLDDSETAKEFREYLSVISSDYLDKYASECLSEIKFDDSGFALQDITNEVGKRLGFDVEYGRYRGSSSQIGYDGLWTTSTKEAIVVEIKTTDAYTIDLERVSGYRKELIARERINADKSSILVVVGRFDTAGWESQIRGSRHAWDIRIISVEYLIRLLKLKESLDDSNIFIKIRNILTPQEYTRVDRIVDVVFSTAEDIQEDEEDIPEDNEQQDNTAVFSRSKARNVSFHTECAERLAKHLDTPLTRESKGMYFSPNKHSGLICLVSKKYTKPYGSLFWFAFHPRYLERLESTKESYVAFGCERADTIILIPIPVIRKWLDMFNKTERHGGYYWHIHLTQKNGSYEINTKGDYENISVNEYLLK